MGIFRFLAAALPVVFLPSVISFADEPKAVIRGKLIQREGKPPALEIAPGKLISMDGDGPTVGVLKDPRLAGADLEAHGEFKSPELFAVAPIHTKAVFVHKDGKRLMVTYWCDICSIRTYTPGLCWCCQEDTELDLREPEKE
ncbi:MAG: hypothetical protein WD696_02825 [Bryobacteraceae bacterium]